MFAFITHMRVKPGKRDAFIALTGTMQAETASEEGVPIYVFHTAEDAPDDFWFYDLYESQEAYDLHNQSDAFRNMMGSFTELAEMVSAKKLIPYGPVKGGPVRK